MHRAPLRRGLARHFGDLAAAIFVLKIVHRRCAIMGFDKIDDDLSGAVNTIVIGGSEPCAHAAESRLDYCGAAGFSIDECRHIRLGHGGGIPRVARSAGPYCPGGV